MQIHTAVHHRLDVVDLWFRAMRRFMPHAELHIWFSADRPSCGDFIHPMPHVGIGAARYVLSALPLDSLRLFVECDMIPVSGWTLEEYPADLVMLEGAPGKRWPGITFAAPCVNLSDKPLLIPQRYARDGGCPDWVPAELKAAVLDANAKVVGKSWIHLDKMHRPQGKDEAKTRLLELMSSRLPEPRKGLGDLVEIGLTSIGVTKARVAAVLGHPCGGCSERQRRLNAIGRQFGIG